jgi:hypothetical protein
MCHYNAMRGLGYLFEKSNVTAKRKFPIDAARDIMHFHRTSSIEVKSAKNRICEIPGDKIYIESPNVDSPSKYIQPRSSRSEPDQGCLLPTQFVYI